MCTDTVKIFLPDIFHQCINIRMVRLFIQLQVLIYKSGRYRNGWFCNQHRTFDHRRKLCQFFPDSFCQCRSTHKTVRNICPDLYPTLHQFPAGQSQIIQLIHRIQHGGSIRASSCHPRRYRNSLCQFYGNSICKRKLFL